MNNLTLTNEILAVSRIDFNGEEWNYVVLSKDKIYNNEQQYKVQWWSQSMGFYWSNYSMSFNNAFSKFYLKVKGNIPNIERYVNKTTNHIDYKNYMKERLEHLLRLHSEEMLSEEDINELIDELS